MGETGDASSSHSGHSNQSAGNYSFYQGNLILPHVDSISSVGNSSGNNSNAVSSSESILNKLDDDRGKKQGKNPKKIKKNRVGIYRGVSNTEVSANAAIKLPPITNSQDSSGVSLQGKLVNVKSIAGENEHCDTVVDARCASPNLLNSWNIAEIQNNSPYSSPVTSLDSYSSDEEDDTVYNASSTSSCQSIGILPVREEENHETAVYGFSNKIVTKSKLQNLGEHRTGSLPDLYALNKCQVLKVSHVTKNDSEAESEPGNKISYKVRPLPSISSDEEPENSEDVISNCDVPASSKPSKKSFRDAAKMIKYIPRVPTSQVRGRKEDHKLADIQNYLPDHKLKLFVGTWNMKGTKCLPDSLDDFLLPPESEYLQDVFVIGTQEGTPFRHEWQMKLQETFGPSHVLMSASNFGVLQMSVFVRRELVWFCSKVEEDNVATRVAPKIKTKGALAMCFKIFGTSFLFINSHFTSHEGKLQERLNDYNSICNNLHFPSFTDGVSSSDSVGRPRITDQFDRVFWFGDFNFRVQKPRKSVDKIISNSRTNRAGVIKELLIHDQLSNVFGEIFHGFREFNIHFMPTYKFDVNTDTYDTSSKQRVPSWTDRVLYKTTSPGAITPLCYNSCTSIKNSDHKSVYGIFEVSIEAYKTQYVLTGGGQFDHDIYVEANMRRVAPTGSQDQSHVCTII